MQLIIKYSVLLLNVNSENIQMHRYLLQGRGFDESSVHSILSVSASNLTAEISTFMALGAEKLMTRDEVKLLFKR